MFFKHKEKKISKSEQKFNNFMEEYKAQRFGTPQPPPTRIVRDGGTRIFNCEPPKGSKPKPPRNQYGDDNSITNTPAKLGKILETIQTGNDLESLTAAMELLEICKEREKESQKENKTDTANYILVTRDEYLLNFIKKFGGNEEKAIESFNNISKGYNFVLAIDENHFYSVDYINKLLER